MYHFHFCSPLFRYNLNTILFARRRRMTRARCWRFSTLIENVTALCRPSRGSTLILPILDSASEIAVAIAANTPR